MLGFEKQIFTVISLSSCFYRHIFDVFIDIIMVLDGNRARFGKEIHRDLASLANLAFKLGNIDKNNQHGRERRETLEQE